MGINTVNGQTLPASTTPLTTLSPTVSINSATPGFGAVTVTISNHSSYTNPNYSVVSKLSDDTVMVAEADVDRFLESDGSHLAGTLNFTDTNVSTAERTIHVRAHEFVDSRQSDATSVTYTPSYIQKKYIRIRGVDSGGNDHASRLSINDIMFFTDSNQDGTEYPTTDLTAADSETGIVVSAGHTYSDTYAVWKAADSSSGTIWWALATTAPNNWWQIEFEDGTYETKPIIKSMTIGFNWNTTSATHIKITGSDNADHSSATDFGVFKLNIISGINKILNIG